MKPKVSIIIPIYNVESYLRESINSILQQKYQNYEIIAIDDGSTDGSSRILDEYDDNEKIKIVHKKNEGVSIARNLGINMAKGEYIAFIDADDSIEDEFLTKMVENIENYDMTVCCYREHFVNCDIDHKYVNKSTILDNKEAISEIHNKSYYGGYLWNKLFKRKIIMENNIQFSDGVIMYEDVWFVSQYLIYCSKIIIIPDILYNYRMRNSSAVWNKNNNEESMIFVYKKLLNLFEKNNIDTTLIYYRILCFLYSSKRKNIELDFNSKKVFRDLVRCKKIKKSDKIKLLIYKYAYFIYVKYMNTKKGKNILFE